MYASTSFTSHFVHEILEHSHSRKLLLQNPLNQTNPPTTSINSHNSTDLYLGSPNFDANVVMILLVLLCAVICSLGLNSIIRCVFRCSNLVINIDSSSSNPSLKLANIGIKKKTLKTFPIVTYSAEMNLPSLDTECVICLSEFDNDDKVRLLPKCNHAFHVTCIDKWLSSHSSCPKCRQCLIETSHKIVGSQATVVPLPVPETVIRIEPLEPEGLVRNYREAN
ncbi:PREDICTED: RING-H2 finger protein ATL78-like [Lupinus angustifolius]|uniref:RING-H2 finger protein ATL78-like n=1 Tax=Lupinus angustifolius TaxID=3871 RepID=UPI00092E3B50|nr:PREDICTED: RING-H2 finger protein ATL78-like [Lupinus angustifolius]